MSFAQTVINLTILRMSDTHLSMAASQAPGRGKHLITAAMVLPPQFALLYRFGTRPTLGVLSVACNFIFMFACGSAIQ